MVKGKMVKNNNMLNYICLLNLADAVLLQKNKRRNKRYIMRINYFTALFITKCLALYN